MGHNEQRTWYLIKNSAILAVGNIASRLISFFLVPLYTNTLTIEQYGTADLVTTICIVLAPIIILNISEGIMRFALDKDANHIQIMSIGIVFFVASILIGLLIIPVTTLIPSLSQYAIYIYLYTIMLAGSQLFLCNLRGKELLTKYAVGNIIQATATAVLNIIYLLSLHQGLRGYFKAYIIASLITMIYALAAGNIKEVVSNLHINKKLTADMIKYSVVLIPNMFMWWIINSSDRIMVTAMISAAANGIYAISYKIPSLVQTVANVFNQAWSYSAIREQDSTDRDSYSNQIYKGIVFVSVTSAVALIAIIKPLLKVYVMRSYYEAWKYTPYLLIGYTFLTIGTFLATSYTVNKDSKGYLFSGTFGALVNIILNYFLIPELGIAGAALATCFSYITVFIYRVIDTKRYVKIDVINRKHILAYIILLLTGFTLYIESIYGQILLILEVIIELVLFVDIWKPILVSILKRIK